MVWIDDCVGGNKRPQREVKPNNPNPHFTRYHSTVIFLRKPPEYAAERIQTEGKRSPQNSTLFPAQNTHRSRPPPLDTPAKKHPRAQRVIVLRVSRQAPHPIIPPNLPPSPSNPPLYDTSSNYRQKSSYPQLLALAKLPVIVRGFARLTGRRYIPLEPGTMSSSSPTPPRQSSQMVPPKRDPISRSTTPRPPNPPPPPPQAPTNDHTLSSFRHRLSQREYPPDCPPLNVRWFYAVDVRVNPPLRALAIRREELRSFRCPNVSRSRRRRRLPSPRSRQSS